ncbi:S1 family peptidase [Pendulispora brunnea]|uniref:S1 family peptidase n=1 Tax=Pendulispora brunnea TaxID=2905690 RepID=A0ABZ2JUA9_9BACT
MGNGLAMGIRLWHIGLATLGLGMFSGCGSPGTNETAETDGPSALQGIDAESRAKMAAQEPLIRAANVIQQSIDTANPDGYATLALEDDHVAVWWKGTPPESVLRGIEAARKIAPIQLRAAEHSRAELRDAAEKVANYIDTHRSGPYYGVDVAYNGSGLKILADPDASPEAGGARVLAAASKVDLAGDLGVPAGIAVTVSREVRPLDTRSRGADTQPYIAGARIVNVDTHEECTSSFAMKDFGGFSYLLTAGHCGRPGGLWNNGAGARIGVGSNEQKDHDVLLIRVNQSAGYMWDGPPSHEFVKRVSGWSDTRPGMWLCTSGATSGPICNHHVSGDFTYKRCGVDTYGKWECYSDLVRAHLFNNVTASRGGDSGGPVFRLEGADRVIAQGVISGVRRGDGRTDGYTDLIFQDFATVRRDFPNMYILTQ